ncbi:MAG: Crp/Fnr family transcriptional regulator [Lysobacteraceae bacterium]|nr:MAG: Crp/Fnr family transcriptional regulator [Xanthomonadaceae bacterium]
MGGAQHEQALAQTLSAAYPLLQELPAALREAVMAASAVHEFRDGAMVFGEHQGCGGLPLVLQGAVKVFKRSEAGREIVLYRVARGETCVLTSSCLLGGSDYSADGAAEGALRLAMVPASLFQRMIAESPAFRGFLFATLSERLAGLMERVERLAFHRLDRRIGEFLVERADAGFLSIAMTHQQIADEIGSVREMVTRTLGQMAEQGLVELSRSGVRIADAEGVRALAAGERAGDKGH